MEYDGTTPHGENWPAHVPAWPDGRPRIELHEIANDPPVYPTIARSIGSASDQFRKAAGLTDPPVDCTRCNFMRRTDPDALCPDHS